MMDGEKRIVTFMGEAGRRTANIIYKEEFNMFKVECEIEGTSFKLFKLFMDESKAQAYAEEFAFKEKNGTI
jgi:hypothetical protein